MKDHKPTLSMSDAAKGVVLALHALAISILSFAVIVLCKCASFCAPGDNVSTECVLNMKQCVFVVSFLVETNAATV